MTRSTDRLFKKLFISTLMLLISINVYPGCVPPQMIPSATKVTVPTPDAFSTEDSQERTQDTARLPSPSALPSATFTIAPTSTASAISDPANVLVSSQDVVWEMLDQVNSSRVQDDLNVLTGEKPICIEKDCYTIENRVSGGEGLGWAKDYIQTQLNGLGYTVEVEEWSLGGLTDQNLIAIKPGEIHPDEKVYFVAHLDGVKKFLRSRFPGADDNASGVVDLLESARILSKYSFDRTLVIFFSTGEEQGRFGVSSHLDQLSQSELSSIKYVVNVDMVGYDANQDNVMELWHGDDASSKELTSLIFETMQDYNIELVPRFVAGCG